MRIFSAWEKLTVVSGEKNSIMLWHSTETWTFWQSKSSLASYNTEPVSHGGEGNAKYFTGIQCWHMGLLESGWHKTLNMHTEVSMPLYYWLSLVSLFQRCWWAVIFWNNLELLKQPESSPRHLKVVPAVQNLSLWIRRTCKAEWYKSKVTSIAPCRPMKRFTN